MRHLLLRSSLLVSLVSSSLPLVACGGVAPDAPAPSPDPATAVHAEPPARPDVVSTGGATRWFAMRHAFLGTVDPKTGESNPDAWRALGFDLDRRVTTLDDSKTSHDTCKRVEGSATGVLADGDDGVDNAFGAHFMQTLKSLKSDIEDVANAGIERGDETILVRLDNLGPDDNAGVPGALYVARDLGAAPTWSEGDHWPVVASSLVDGVDLSKPVATFPAGYMRGGVWVSGPVEATSARIAFTVGAAPFALSPDAMQIVLEPASGKGTISGFTRASDLVASLARGAAVLGICPGNATFDQIALTLTQSADLVADAPGFQDDTQTCDALSFGIGLAMQPTGAPTTVVADAPAPEGCK
jgi:hypothetical protein